MSHLEHDWHAPIWSHLFHELAKKYHFIRYNECGHGLSDWNVKNISFDDFAQGLETITTVTELDKFALLGISQGASVTIDMLLNILKK